MQLALGIALTMSEIRVFMPRCFSNGWSVRPQHSV